jgi:glycine hydroxymethyltransferase
LHHRRTATAARIVANAKVLAASFMDSGLAVISGGTDNHIVLVDVLSTFDITGIVAQQALEECGIIVNKNRIPGDQKAMFIASGIRIGTNSMAARGLDHEAMVDCAELICAILSEVEGTGDRTYELADAKKRAFADEVLRICRAFPIPGYAGGIPGGE